MSQINNSQPTHPVIVFQVNLAPSNPSELSPLEYQQNPDLGRTEATNYVATRSTYFPGLSVGDNRELFNGSQFTMYGQQAQYYRQEIAKGNFKFLSIVSST